MWTYYKVNWYFVTQLCSSVPADPEIRKSWLESRCPRVKPAGGKSISEIQEEVANTILAEPDEEDEKLLVFQNVNNALVMRYSTIRAHLKECARTLSSLYVGKVEGERSFAVRVLHGLYYDKTQYWAPLLRYDGTPITGADGSRDKPVHAKGPHGEPRDCIKTFEYVQDARMEFTLQVLGEDKFKEENGKKKKIASASISQTDLEKLMEYGGTHGYAGERSDGEGRYLFTIEQIPAPTQQQLRATLKNILLAKGVPIPAVLEPEPTPLKVK